MQPVLRGGVCRKRRHVGRTAEGERRSAFSGVTSQGFAGGGWECPVPAGGQRGHPVLGAGGPGASQLPSAGATLAARHLRQAPVAGASAESGHCRAGAVTAELERSLQSCARLPGNASSVPPAGLGSLSVRGEKRP